MHFLLLEFIFLVFLLCSRWIQPAENVAQRSFRVDYKNDRFLKDGKPFRFVAGQFDYFRTVPGKWQRILRTMRAAGLNTVSTYVQWSLHNPHDGQYVWTGMADIDYFMQLAVEEDLLVMLRSSTYISGERSMGGLPHWLLSKYPNITLRSLDPDYLREVRIWYAKMMPRIKRFLYENGGPIIMVQVENEYGASACDHKYLEWMRDETSSYVDDKAVLISNDIDFDNDIKCGTIQNVLEGSNFGVDVIGGIDSSWATLRKYQRNGPLYNGEFYTGWPSHWKALGIESRDAKEVARSLRQMLESGASVNHYMFFGGTNFGFTGGSNTFYKSYITSYDFDAPIDEAGDVTPKFYAIREVIKDFFPLPNITVPTKAPKMQPPQIRMRPRTTLFSIWSRFILGSQPIESKRPLTFEHINQDTGFVLYETMLPETMKNVSVLRIIESNDLSIIYINNTVVSAMERNEDSDPIMISSEHGRFLQILVENEGRKSFGDLNETRGIIGDVFLNDQKLENWTITGFPFEFGAKLNELMDVLPFVKQNPAELKKIEKRSAEILSTDPIIFEEMFDLENGEVHDTYIDPSGWGKGFIIVNGFNLGRYWPLAGPQITLYVPKEVLFKKGNSIVVIEFIQAPKNGEIKFSKSPINRKHFLMT